MWEEFIWFLSLVVDFGMTKVRDVIIAFQCTPELIRTFIERANDIQDVMQVPLLDLLKKLWFPQF